MLAACASIGRPEGGPRDETPPVMLSSNPAPGATNVKTNKIVLTFDENVQLDDPSNKIVISPAQNQAPGISSGGRHVTIELRDTLIPDATYTIDFSDAVKDLNEGNILDGLALDFATGSVIDSMRISGIVLEARTLEPAQGMLVGVYSNLADSAISTLRFERIAKTNQLGQFTIRNLKPGSYRLYAVNDMNRDIHWDRSEDVAFLSDIVVPETEPAEVTDTFLAIDGTDSIVARPSTHYMPDDILLTWFNEGYKAQYLTDYKRPERHKLTFNFGAPSDTFPIITIANGPLEGSPVTNHAVLDYSLTRDTLTYWLTDSQVISMDTLLVSATYLKTDSLDQLSWTTDTLKLNFRSPKPKKEKKEKKKDDENSDSISEPELTFLSFTPLSSGNQDVNRPLLFNASQPLDTLLQNAVKLEMLEDTVWQTLTPPVFYRPDKGNSMLWQADYTWEPGYKYKLSIDSAAIIGVYNQWNEPISNEFTVRALEEYSSLTFTLTGLPDSVPAIAELLNAQDQPVATAPVTDSKVTFSFMNPGTYYARLYIDSDSSGTYTTGNLAAHRQPEDVYYYHKKINLKKNWDVEQPWDLNDLPVDMQKPLEIKKNKPKRRNGEMDERNSDEDEDEDDLPFGANPFDPNARRSRSGNMTNSRL
ncbi:MAG: Ig-like domain-containing protein [Muribaculaceae bacterium]|nr:Ig-like domain-containing protein [Muribaculaceae bacterium]